MIEVENLTRYYGDFPAVRDVSFNIGQNVIVGFLGLNGAGKSTVLKVLGGLLMPSAGTVKVHGVNTLDAPDSSRRKIGYLPEDPPLYKEMRVTDFLLWCGEIKGLSRAEAKKRLPEVLKTCQLEDMSDRIIGTLSHGYKKRVGIAQAIIHQPDLVILDEPISGLDPVQIIEMRRVLKSLRESCTVLISSHILSEISQTCDKILVLHDGQIVAEGTEAELASKLIRTIRVEFVIRGTEAKVRESLEGLDEIDLLDLERVEDALTRATVTFREDAREEVVGRLVASGLGLRSMTEDQTGELEHVFLGLTQAKEVRQ